MKYILNPILFLSNDNDSFYFTNKINGKKFQINKTLYEFLKILEYEMTYETLLSKYKEYLRLGNIDTIVNNFFNDALKKTLIIPLSEVKEVMNNYVLDFFQDDRFTKLDILYQSKKSIIYKLIDKENKLFIFKTKFDINGNVILKDLLYELEMHKSLSDLKFIPALYSGEIISNGLIFEFIEGFTLSKKNIQNITTESKKTIFSNILYNYMLLEKKQFFHGDIHVGNLICNNDFEVFLIDFGESFYEGKNTFNKNAANHYFTPPERIGENIFKKFNSSSSRHSEIYQLSLILYYLFYNHMPFNGNTWKELRKNILESQVETKDNISKEINNFIIKGLNKNPLSRFNTINEMYEIFKK